jgi:hypothetical protein
MEHMENDLLPESQCGFRAGRGTADMIFASRQLQTKCQEQHHSLYTIFVDLTKAFNIVSKEGYLWKIMARYGCPPTFITMVHQFHGGMMAHVLDNGQTSNRFPVGNEMKPCGDEARLRSHYYMYVVFSHAFGHAH